MIAWRRIVGALGFLALALCAAASVGPSYLDPDMFHGLALAREFARTGSLPIQDRFAYTPTHPLIVHHEWLAFWLLYVAVERFGGGGLTVLALVLQGGAIAGVLLLARRQGARLPVLCLLAPLGLTLLAPGLTTLRAQVWSLACTVGVLACIEADRRGRRWWIGPFLLMHVAWLNLHAGFVIGLGLVLLHTMEQALRRRPVGHLFATIAAAGALVVVNPYGPGYLPYLADALRMDRSMIAEWRPLSDGHPFGIVAWMLSLLVVVYGAARCGVRNAPGLLLLVVTALLSLRHQRHVSIYAIVWLAYVPPLVARTPLAALVERWWATRPLVVAAALVGAIVLVGSRVLAAAPWRLDLPTRPGTWSVTFPAGAVDYLSEVGFEGNVMTPFEVGAFVSWKLHPAVRVSLDGRFEVAYPHEVFVDHGTFYGATDGWQSARDRYPADAVLVATSTPVAEALRREGRWPLRYEDDAYLIFMRPERAASFPRVSRRGETPAGRFP